MRTEVLAGVTTFMTMAYILFVNPPAILSDAMGKEAFNSLVAVTALAAGFATLLMGLYAKKPFALAPPGMGLNATSPTTWYSAWATTGAWPSRRSSLRA